MAPTDITQLIISNPGWGLSLVVAWLVYQVYAPKYLGVETRMSPLFGLDERMARVEEQNTEQYDKLRELDEKQVHHIQVTRAQARAIDADTDVTVSSEDVDEYLVDNGVPVSMLTRASDDGQEGNGNISLTTTFDHTVTDDDN